MSRSSAALQQWLNFRKNLSAPRSLRPNALFAPAPRLILSTSPNGTSLPKRTFYGTPYRPAKANRNSARPAPALRRRKREEAGYEATKQAVDGGALSNRGFYMDGLRVDREHAVATFKKMSDSLYRDAVRTGLLRDISYRTFEDVIIKLLKGIDGPPNPHLIRSISTDVDAVFRIAFIGCFVNQSLTEWVVSACALAGARQPVVIIQARLVTWSKTPPRTKWTDLVKQFSDEGFPPAMMLQAKIHGMRGEYEEAFELMETRVLPYLKPTRRSPTLFEDITMGGAFESPWRVYALLHASYDDKFDSYESRQKADDAIRIAALDYNDPQALVEYASIMMSEKNYDKYEECMCRAATFGNKDAILYLANFYYQIYHGRYPTTAERVALAKAKAEAGQQPSPTSTSASTSPSPSQTSPSPSEPEPKPNIFTPVVNWITSFFGQSMSREDYRKLALDWYALGFEYSIPQASFMLALMAREQGESLGGSEIMEHAVMHLENHPEFAKKIEELREHWYDPEYVPRLSSKMLAVR